MGLFIQSRKWMNLKFTRKLCAMAMKNDAKFEEELTCQLNINIRNLTNIYTSTRNSQKFCSLMRCFWPKYVIFELKKVKRSYVWWHWRLIQNLKENWLVLSHEQWSWQAPWRICKVFVHRLKNCDFILESKKAELN